MARSYNIDVPILLSHLGIRARRAGRTTWEAKCPNPAHPDKKPSWRMIDNPSDEKRHGSHHCQSCKFGGGPWELAAAVWGVDLKEAGKRLRDLFEYGKHTGPIEVPTVTIRIGEPPKKDLPLPYGVFLPGPGGKWYEPAWNYLLDRSITPEQVEKWNLGYGLRGKYRNRVFIPIYNGAGRMISYTGRTMVNDRERYMTAREIHGAEPRRAMWGEHKWAPGGGIVTIAEGVVSGLALERAGAPNPTALLGSNLTEEKSAILRKFRGFLIATDPDAAGDRVAEFLSTFGRRVPIYRIRLDVSPDDAKPEVLRDAVREGIGTLRRNLLDDPSDVT